MKLFKKLFTNCKLDIKNHYINTKRKKQRQQMKINLLNTNKLYNQCTIDIIIHCKKVNKYITHIKTSIKTKIKK